jgi:uncharacterized protein YqeY
MTVQEKINGDLRVAMKESNKEAKDILRVVIGEFNRIGKEISDANATSIIKKMVGNANEMNNISEANFLGKYLPKQLTEDQIDMLVSQIIEDESIDSIKGMGKIMNILQKEYAGQYDGKLASTIIKDKLK